MGKEIFKHSYFLITTLVLPTIALAATQSHPLSQITPIDTNLNMKVAGTFKSSANGAVLQLDSNGDIKVGI